MLEPYQILESRVLGADCVLLILACRFSTVGCDQVTKSIAKAELAGMQPLSFLGDTLRLDLARNYGAFLSLGSALGESSGGMVLSALVGLVLAGGGARMATGRAP